MNSPTTRSATAFSRRSSRRGTFPCSKRSSDAARAASASAWSCSHGPFTYKSDKDPVPLDEAETAMLVAAATGVTGAILCEGEFQGGMVKSVGRPHPSAVGSHRTELFFTNDDGVFLFRGTQQKMTKMKEYETVAGPRQDSGFLPQIHGQAIGQAPRPAAQDAGPVSSQSLGHQQAGRHAVHAGHRHQQGSDPADDQHVRLAGAAATSMAAATTSSTSARACGPAGCEKWAAKGLLDKNKPLPLGALEKIIVSWLCAEGAMMGTLMQLAMAAMGLGGWMHGGFTPLVVMGGTPVCGASASVSSRARRSRCRTRSASTAISRAIARPTTRPWRTRSMPP